MAREKPEKTIVLPKRKAPVTRKRKKKRGSFYSEEERSEVRHLGRKGPTPSSGVNARGRKETRRVLLVGDVKGKVSLTKRGERRELSPRRRDRKKDRCER